MTSKKSKPKLRAPNCTCEPCIAFNESKRLINTLGLPNPLVWPTINNCKGVSDIGDSPNSHTHTKRGNSRGAHSKERTKETRKRIILNNTDEAITRHHNFTNATQTKIQKRLERRRFRNVRENLELLLFNCDNFNSPLYSHFPAIRNWGKIVINELHQYFDEYEGDIFHMTIVDDDWNAPIGQPHFDVSKCTRKVRNFFGRHLKDFSMVGFVEFQIVKFGKSGKRKTYIAMHTHIIVFGRSMPKGLKDAIYDTRTFSSSKIKPILIQNVPKRKSDYLRLLSYQCKISSKNGIYEKKDDGSVKHTSNPLSFSDQMRLLEVLSYMPISKRIFTRRHGIHPARDILREIEAWQSQLDAPWVKLNERQKGIIWKKFWEVQDRSIIQTPTLIF